MSASVNRHLQLQTTTNFVPTPEFCAQVNELYRFIGELKASIDSPGGTLSKSKVRQLIDTIRAMATAVSLSDLDPISAEEGQQQPTSTTATTSNPNQLLIKCPKSLCTIEATSFDDFEKHMQTHTDELLQLVRPYDEDDDDQDNEQLDAPFAEPGNVELSTNEPNPGTSVRVEDIQRTPKVRKGGKRQRKSRNRNLPPRIHDEEDLEDLELANWNPDDDDGDQAIRELVLARDVAQQSPPRNEQIHGQNREDDQEVVERIAPIDADDDDGQEVLDGIDPNDVDDADGDDLGALNRIDPNADAQLAVPHPADENPNQLRKSTRPRKAPKKYVGAEWKTNKRSGSEKRFELNRDTLNLPPIRNVIVAHDRRIKRHLRRHRNQQIGKVIVVCND